MKLQKELGWKQGFHSTPHEALLNLYFTASRIKKHADEFFRKRGLTEVQFNVLALLGFQSGEKGGLTQVELSRMMLVNRANVTSLVDRMEKGKLVRRCDDPGDRRYNVIRLTPQGKKMFEQVEQDYAREVNRMMSPLKKSQLSSLIDMLEQLRENLIE